MKRLALQNECVMRRAYQCKISSHVEVGDFKGHHVCKYEMGSNCFVFLHYDMRSHDLEKLLSCGRVTLVSLIPHRTAPIHHRHYHHHHHHDAYPMGKQRAIPTPRNAEYQIGITELEKKGFCLVFASPAGPLRVPTCLSSNNASAGTPCLLFFFAWCTTFWDIPQQQGRTAYILQSGERGVMAEEEFHEARPREQRLQRLPFQYLGQKLCEPFCEPCCLIRLDT